MELKDLSQLRKYIAVNNVNVAVVPVDGLFGGYNVIFISDGYKFGLSTQKRNDRNVSLREFSSVDTAITVLKKVGIKGRVSLML